MDRKSSVMVLMLMVGLQSLQPGLVAAAQNEVNLPAMRTSKQSEALKKNEGTLKKVAAGRPRLPAEGANREATGLLANPDFEQAPASAGWELAVYGARPQVELDSQIVRVGRHSLRVTAAEDSDTALGQEVALKPNQWYRLSGWIKTRDLKPVSAATYGSLQVQRPGGRGIIAAGPNHGAETDWTQTAVFFQAPADGRARIGLFFTGFGTGTGTAWFDGLKLEEVDVSRAPVKVQREPLLASEINPFQYGQFVEYLNNLIPAMWSEKLYDGSFEGLSPYNFAFIKETDFKEKPWYPSGATNRAEYILDRETKVSGEVSQRIAVEPGPPATAGLSQDGIFVERGAAHVFKCFLRARGLRGPVRVTLHTEGRVHAQCEFTPTAHWKKYSARLVPSGRALNATLTVEFRGPATLWLDNASLMPEDTVGGWRRDVVEATRALKPGIIRFGGTALEVPSFGDFEWKDTIGDPDRRKPFRAWGGLQPTGPGLEEIVQFCHAVGAEPLIAVRFSDRTPKDAAEQVEYFNGPIKTPMGALRAKNGHPKPYRIKYWQVGNEIMSPIYDEQLAAFCQAMKQADPAIKLLSSYPTPKVIRNAGPLLDYVAPHHYTPDLAFMDSDLTRIQQMIRDNAPGRPIKIAVTEWNTTGGDAGPRRAMLWSLANALAVSRYHNLLHRRSDIVEIANRSNLINSFGSGIIQTDTHRLYKTPAYYAQWLYANFAGNRPLKLDSALSANVGLDLSATLSTKGDEVILFAVNDTLQDMTRSLDFSSFGAKGQKVSVWTLADSRKAGEPDVTNSFSDPRRVVARKSTFEARSPRFAYRFPALSLTVLRWKASRAGR